MELQLTKSWNNLLADPAAGNAGSQVRRNLHIVGTLTFSGSLQVDGEVHGSVIGRDDSTSQLTLGETGVIEGEVKVMSALIQGRVRGNVHASRHLTLTAKSVIHGDVHYRELEIAQGAVVDGRLIFEGDSQG